MESDDFLRCLIIFTKVQVMKKLLLLPLILYSNLCSNSINTFTITNKEGNIIKKKQINHVKNIYYDDLLKEQDEILQALERLEEKRKKIQGYDKSNILKNAKHHLGENYVWGGTKPNAFDCSGYVQYVYQKEGIQIPRTAYQQSKVGQEVSRKYLKKGDLLFFLTDRKRGIPITHVGMYIGENKFIHAASRKKGIIISPFTSKSKYGKLFVKATRIIE